jgi:hypothetical protein
VVKVGDQVIADLGPLGRVQLGSRTTPPAYLAEVTNDEWQLVKRAIGIDRGWEAAYRLVSTLDLLGQDIPANLTPEGT